MDIRDFLARHLNDHEESVRGVRQPTFFTWSKAHVTEAVTLALTFLYSLVPEKFGKLKTFTVQEEDCIISFCEECGKFLGIVDIEIDGRSCLNISENKANTNSLFASLNIGCTVSGPRDRDYTWSYVDNSACVIRFDHPLPKGTIVRYLCAKAPGIEDLETDLLAEYLSIIAEYAAFWLFRTDSESKSNLERATHHWTAVQYLVQTKLMIEFSLREDDYLFGHRKVEDK